MSNPAIVCPSPLTGRIGEISLIVPEQRLTTNGTVELVCCNVVDATEVCGPALHIAYLPEPSGTLMLLVGVAALAARGKK